MIFGLPLFIVFIFSKPSQIRLIYGYFSGISVMLLVYFDSWPHHIVVLAPFLIFFVLLEKDFDRYTLFKYIYYLIAFLLFGFWILFYLTYEIFPFNLGGTILFIVLYYLLIKYYLNQIRTYL